MTTAMTTTGVGAVSVHNPRKVARNRDGLSYHEWLKTAGRASSKKAWHAWKRSQSPLDYSAAEDNPLSTEVKIAIGVGVAVAAIGSTVGLVYLYKKAKAKTAGAKTWKRASVLQPGDRVRMAIDVATWTALANVPFGVPATPQGLAAVLAGPDFNASAVTVYAPMQALPGDWPTPDPGAGVYHASFIYNGQQPLNVAQYHSPTFLGFVWTIQ